MTHSLPRFSAMGPTQASSPYDPKERVEPTEFRKAKDVTLYLARQYLKAVFQRDKSVNRLFTDLYLRSLFRRRNIPTLSVAELFPARAGVEISLFEDLSYLHGRDGSEGYSLHSPTQSMVLATLIRLAEPGSVFEIGTHLGGMTYNFHLNTSRQCQISTLDISDQIAHPALLEQIKCGRVKQYLEDSTRFDFSKFSGKVDFVFVDGGHSLECVTQDSENALKMVSEGGFIVWDDYSPEFPEVFAYLEGLSKRIKLFHLENTGFVLYVASRSEAI